MKESRPKAFVCCICGCFIVDEWGNNAEPIAEGRCCDSCNYTHVIPVRIAQIYKDMEDKDEVQD